MDYKKIYDSIVSSKIEFDGYTENHHIIPKCLGGGNDKNNIVKISYRKHFLCHWLLCKNYPDNFKLKAAFCKMLECGKNKKRIVSSREFDIVKRVVKDLHYGVVER